ncbi:MAG: dihydroorotate dehydrogenase electron transfer subunit [Lentisphaeria bacterium]
MVKSFQSDALIVSNQQIQGDYYKMQLEAPQIAAAAHPGQFIHVQIPDMEHRILRRPFSISDADAVKGILTIVYKVVGVGTEQLKKSPVGSMVNILGPRGNGFSPLPAERRAILVGGGYGCAAIYLLAHQAVPPPLILLGGRSQQDIIMVPEFTALGCDVRLSTDDGSLGEKGRVTLLLEKALTEFPAAWVAACGPIPMLKAVSLLSADRGLVAEVSLDSVMCCGMGACFACVVKKKADNEQGWIYVRACQDGPVFKSSEVYWD